MMFLNKFDKKLIVSIQILGIMFLLVLFLGGCGGTKTATLPNVPPSVVGQIPVKHERIGTTASVRPAWINEAPEDTARNHFMTGLSDFFKSEKSAREAAMQDARAQYARYTGVEVSEIDEIARYFEGHDSETLDGSIVGKTKKTQKTDARVSRIKPKFWYTETFTDSKRQVYSGTSYKTWVLVTIPLDEDTRVAEWRMTKAKNIRAAHQEVEASAEAELKKVIAGQKNKLQAIDVAMAQGQVLQALSLLQQQSKLLVSEQKRFFSGPTNLKAKASKIDALQIELTGKVQAVQAKLVLDSGRFGGLLLVPTQSEKAVPVWAWLRHDDGVVPVSELPLILKDQQGKTLAQAITDPSGRAVFYLPSEISGPVVAGVDIGMGMTGLLPEEIRNRLSRATCCLNLAPTGNDFYRSVKYGVQELFSGGVNSKLVVEQVLLGPVTYESTGLGGEFPQLLKKHLRQALMEVNGLSLVEPRRRDVMMVENAVKTRGIKMAADKPAPSIGSSAMQAMMDGADAAIEGTYSVQPEGVRVDLSLHQARTDIVLEAVSLQIPLEAISAGVDLVPEQSGTLSSIGQTVNSSINVEITSQYGNGQTYTEGEAINYFASLNRDAYLLLIYEDAVGTLLQIFPNSRSKNQTFRAGSAIQVPGENDPFEFEISSPFGREQVFAFASNKPFPSLSGDEHSSGLKILNIGMDKILRTLRVSGSQPGTAYGEAFTVLTTVAKK